MISDAGSIVLLNSALLMLPSIAAQAMGDEAISAMKVTMPS